MDDNIKEVPMDYALALTTFDALNVLRAEAEKTLEESDDLIPSVYRELQATAENAEIMINRIGKEFGFEHGD